jgi:UDP-glucose 4-epimerase
VIILDNFSTGQQKFVEHHHDKPNVNIHNVDLLQFSEIEKFFRAVDVVVHLSANADVRFGWDHPTRDLEQNIVATQNVLEAMRKNEVRKLIFSSTGSVYGEAKVVPTPENYAFPIQTSLYGASKVAAEAFISAYCEQGFIDATVFRFVSILGQRYTHGHVIDFAAKLKINSDVLTVLGNGTQRKSYLHVDDCIDAILSRLNSGGGLETFNLGTNENCTVNDSVGWITARLGLSPRIEYTGGDRGWIGDNPVIQLDTSKINATGWQPKRNIQESIESTIDWIVENPWSLDLAVTTTDRERKK